MTDAYTGLPLAATVTLTGTLGAVYQVQANSAGYYDQPAEPDTYTLRATAPGYRPATVSGVAVGDSPVVRDLALDPDAVLHVTAAALAQNLFAGRTATQTLRLENAGSGGLHVALAETAGPAPGAASLAFDGPNLAPGAALLAYDVPWLAESPAAGIVAPGEALTVSVTFDAAGLAPETYTAGLEVASNDPDTPLLQLPVTLTVAALWPAYLPLVVR
ncbi:MAG: carboxypeptidase-like regulatory domain-containing protein [Anaerolineae bacterium]